MSDIPNLKHFEGSWVVTHRVTGQRREFFVAEREKVRFFAEHDDAYLVEPIGKYLSRIQGEQTARRT